jgi:hypothetical protein
MILHARTDLEWPVDDSGNVGVEREEAEATLERREDLGEREVRSGEGGAAIEGDEWRYEMRTEGLKSQIYQSASSPSVFD